MVASPSGSDGSLRSHQTVMGVRQIKIPLSVQARTGLH